MRRSGRSPVTPAPLVAKPLSTPPGRRGSATLPLCPGSEPNTSSLKVFPHCFHRRIGVWWGMFQRFRRRLAALEGIRDALGGLLEAVHELPIRSGGDAELEGRVARLELELERRHAEAEGLLLRAQGKFDAARAAEERTRRLAERAEEGDEDELEAIRAAYEEAGVPLGDEEGSEANGVQPVPSAMEARASSKQSAYAMKWAGR